jgi:hypothetical protein
MDAAQQHQFSESAMLDIDLGKIVTTLGENTIADIGEPLGLDRELSIKAATSLVKNFHGDKDEAIAAAVAETGIGKDVLEAMITKLLEEARTQAMGAVKEQTANVAKGMFSKFFGR